jgi:methyl-accepting chemotaxis protein
VATSVILFACLASVALTVSHLIEDQIEKEAISSQNQSLLIAATIIERDIPGVTVSWAANGDAERISAASLPSEFSDHDMIDSIGRMTDETATLFTLDETTSNLVRRTTNVIKSDGARAVGTFLDPNGAPYAAIKTGNTFQGEASILGVRYYTLYKPIFSASGNVIGVLYVGVKADEIDGLAGRFAKPIGYVSGLIFLISVVVVGLLTRRIMRPLPQIAASIKKLACGDTEADIPFANRTDEIGAIANAVEIFRHAAITNKRLEKEAEQSRLLVEQQRVAAQQKAEADAAERLRVATSGLAAGLKQLSAGNLSVQLTETFAPDFEPLRHDFNQSVRQLGAAMADISMAIATIDNGTREIAVGAGDLSKRTEHQAASLEETAAALDEITANVQSSTQRTEEARAVAVRANQSAIRSAEVVSHAEEAMKKIEASSQQISSIISVIDEIAFQTNLLALNAGVEAARAGDAGKGFAVVAQEVRELAQRSAQAAKEIKHLIENSSTEVEGGVKLVREAGDALKTIGVFIMEMNSHMESIATSANEQSTGLAEVNVAVNSMDQNTQQNAAMVEQSNAASSTLAMEAARLRELVNRFELEDLLDKQIATLRQTAKSMPAPVSPMRAVAATPFKAAAMN